MAATIIDSDVGTDPDDTCVAIMAARHSERFGVVLMVTNDETATWAKARFARRVVDAAGGGVRIAAGLASLKRRDTDLAEKAGLAPTGEVDRDGVARIVEVLEAHDSVDYIGLGALTNLDAALEQRPELAARVRLYQMGPAIAGGFDRARPQYNARIDPQAFARVLARVPTPTLIATHTTWGNWNKPRPPLGVFPEDALGRALASSSRPDLALYARHLHAFVASGKDCSILHDPATLLASREPELVDLAEVDVTLDEHGWLHLTPDACAHLRGLDRERTACVSRAFEHAREAPGVRVRLSLGARYDRIRQRVVELLWS